MMGRLALFKDGTMNFFKAAEKISRWTGALSAWLIIPLMLVVVYEVICRHIFNNPTSWSYDTAWMLFSAQFFIGGAYTLLKKAHIRIDIVYNLLSERGKSIFDLLIYIFVITIPVLLFTGAGIKFASEAWISGEKLSTTNWFFPAGPPKTLIPLGFFLLALQSIAEIVRLVQGLAERRDK
jgi:TRAP-type mannitol/chloroaromatic compound transport system permease small subunit